MISNILLIFAYIGAIFSFLHLREQNKKIEWDVFSSHLSQKLTSTYKYLENEKMSGQSQILHPAGVWVVLGKYFFFENGFLLTKKSCLLYKIPFREKKGVLKFITDNSKLTCEDHFFDPSEVEFKNIETLEYKVEKNVLVLKILSEDKKNYDLKVSLINLKENKKPLVRFSKSSEKRKYQGLLLGGKLVSEFSYKKNSFLKSGDLCHDIDLKCHERSPFKCSFCPGGFYSVVSNGCLIGGKKFCGKDSCGMKNYPACFRGQSYFKKKYIGNYCLNANQISFCLEGLVPKCDSKGVIVCM